MKLPNVHQLEIAPEKITHHLLSATHFDGRHNAAYFRAFGFSLHAWELLGDALRAHANAHDVTASEDSPFGKRYVIDGILNAADGRTPQVRSVWFIRTEEDIPRFVTAYPLKGESS